MSQKPSVCRRSPLPPARFCPGNARQSVCPPHCKAVEAKNFWKLYLGDFLPVLGIVESKQVDILIYILENTQPSTNMFVGTYKTI